MLVVGLRQSCTAAGNTEARNYCIGRPVKMNIFQVLFRASGGNENKL